MDLADAGLLAAAGLASGAINAAAGGGSLLSFPALVAAGLDPLAANVTNTVGLVPGYAGGAAGHRSQLKGHGDRVRELAIAGAVGAVAGVAALLLSPEEAFEAVVPPLVAFGCMLLLAAPRIQRMAADGTVRPARRPIRLALVFAGAAYGAYFGAVAGILLLALLGLTLTDPFARLNAFKATITLTANAVAAVGFAIFGPVHWGFAATIGISSVFGGFAGASLAQRVDGDTLRRVTALAGLGAALWLAIR